MHLKIKPIINRINTTNLTLNDAKKELKNVSAVIVPGGFGERGAEGKINIIRIAREQKIPFLGLCYGLQMAVIEYARNICKLQNANTTEIDESTKYPVITILEDKKNIYRLGGTLRLGSYPVVLKNNTIVKNLYNKDIVYERHRHRFEVNPKYHEILEKN